MKNILRVISLSLVLFAIAFCAFGCGTTAPYIYGTNSDTLGNTSNDILLKDYKNESSNFWRNNVKIKPTFIRKVCTSN